MRVCALCFFAIVLLGLQARTTTEDVSPSLGRVPVVVELFTSEGCSSCPPADRLLQSFDQRQPFSKADLIVMSEHVDYWNQMGWKDPYSAKLFSARQERYMDQFGGDTIYTPQLVIDGRFETSGNNPQQANAYIEKSAQKAKVEVTLSNVAITGKTLRFHVSSANLPTGIVRANVMIAVAQDHASSDVQRGENAGHSLTHVAVVRTLSSVGLLAAGTPFAKDVILTLPGKASPSIRLVAFLQDTKSQAILGAALKKLP